MHLPLSNLRSFLNMLFNKERVVSNFGSLLNLARQVLPGDYRQYILPLPNCVFSPTVSSQCLVMFTSKTAYSSDLMPLTVTYSLLSAKVTEFHYSKLRKGTSVLNTMLLVCVCVCTRPSLTQTLRCSWYSLLGAHHTGELFTVVIGTTWQSYSAFCLHVVHESTINVMLVSRNSLRVFVQTDKHCATFMAFVC